MASATAVSSIPTSAERAKQYVQRKAQQRMFYQTIWQRQQNIRSFTDWTTKAGGVITRTFRSVSSSLLSVSGGVMLLVTVMLVAMIAAMAASPFGIFFSGENPGPDAVPVSVAVAMLNQEYTVQLETLQNGANYDDIIIHGAAPDWPEILAVFATKVAGGTGAEAADVVTIDKKRIEQLKAVFWDMVAITSDTEVIQHSGENENDVGWTEKILHITIQTKNAEKMAEQYNFSKQQKAALQELLAQRAMLLALAGTTAIISADADALLKNLPENLSVERKSVIKAACALVGKVNYFWGGKSLTLGWNSAWGELRKVTATGSPTTGTYRPYGLDCSGFVDWAFFNATNADYIIGQGGGVASQRAQCKKISWSDALPGDLVFYADNSHIGIVGGKDKNGNLLVIHCASGANNVVITGVGRFSAIGRPIYFKKKVEQMKVLLLEPGKYAQEIEMDGSLESMQNLVGGSIEAVYLLRIRLQLFVMMRVC